MAPEGSSKVAIAGQADKRSLTAVLTVSMSGEFLPIQLIYPGKTPRSLPRHDFPVGFSLTQNSSHWSNEDTMGDFVQDILEPYLKKQREVLKNADMPALLIYDAFRAHTTDAVQQKLAALNAKLVMVPKNMTDHRQPLDISVNKPVKNYLKTRFNEWYTGKNIELERTGECNYEAMGDLLKSSVALRELGAKWISDIYYYFDLATQKQIIVNGFRHCGIIRACEHGPVNDDPFNSE